MLHSWHDPKPTKPKEIMTKTLAVLTLLTTGALSSLLAGESHVRSSSKGFTPMEPPPPRGGLYVAIFGGLNMAQTGDVEVDDSDGLLGGIEAEIESDFGWFGGLKLGYVFPTDGPVKPVIEVEGFYNGVEAEFDTDSDFGNFDVSADLHSAVFMVNAIAKFECGRFQPYLGAGIGYAHTWFDQVEVDGVEVDGAGDDEGTFAYQGLAGLEFQVSDQLGVFTEYKALIYNDVGDVETYVNHLLGFGVRIGF